MRRNRRRAGAGWSADDKIKYIRIAAIPLIIVIVLVAVIFLMDKKPSVEESQEGLGGDGQSSIEIEIQGEDSSAAGEEIAPDNQQYTMDFSEYELQKDEIPQVNQIISEYFQAKVDQDAQTLFRLFGKAEDDSLEARQEELKNEAVYIEDYQNITCYTKPGLTEDSYVVYVTYEVKFRRVDTLAPGLMWCYVLKGEDGTYIIRENVVGEEADYVAKQNQTEDVRLLSSQVNEQLRQAIESDTLLAGIYKDLRNGAVVSSSEEEDEGGDSQVQFLDEAQGDSQTAASESSVNEESSAQEESSVGQESSSGTESTQTESESAVPTSGGSVVIIE